jgi:hypothetical protein
MRIIGKSSLACQVDAANPEYLVEMDAIAVVPA